MTNPEWTIFHAVQSIIQNTNLGSKCDRFRRVWEPTYVILYRESRETSNPREDVSIGSVGSAPGSRRGSTLPQLPITNNTQCSMDEVLQLVRQLFINCRGEQATKKSVDHPLTKTVDNPLNKQNFLSKKITNKVVTQLQVTFIYIFL